MASANRAPPSARLEDVEAYVAAVQSGERVAGRLERLAVERHLRDQATAEQRGLHFDALAVERVYRFFALLRHSKGRWAGQQFQLAPWQAFVLASLFGWKWKDGTRRFRTSYIEVPRKQGKSTLAAGVGLYLTLGDGEAGAEVYTAATKRDQARIVADEACRMVKASPQLSKLCEVFAGAAAVTRPAVNASMKPLSAEASTLDGLNVHGAVIDELHANRDRLIYDVLDTATGARRQPLMFGITTAGYDRHTVCWEKHEYAVRVLERVVDDDGFFGFLTTIDEGDDWRAEATWQKAMPNLGTTVELSYMRQQASEAQRMPAKENAFKRLLLNVWTEQESRWLQMEAWDAAGCDAAGELVPVAEEDLELRPCFAALDLSSTRDITALVLVFPETDGTYRVVPRFWLPEEAMGQRAERDGVPYDVWVRQGLVRTTPGNVIDYGYVRECILEDARRFSLREVAFDPYNAQKLVNELQAEGLEMVEFRQGFLSMGPALKVLEVAVLKRRLRHGANPVLRWMASNLVVEQDPAGNLKPSKRRSKEKIDGMVALTMALARADAHAGETPEEPSIYVLGEDGETE